MSISTKTQPPQRSSPARPIHLIRNRVFVIDHCFPGTSSKVYSVLAAICRSVQREMKSPKTSPLLLHRVTAMLKPLLRLSLRDSPWLEDQAKETPLYQRTPKVDVAEIRSKDSRSGEEIPSTAVTRVGTANRTNRSESKRRECVRLLAGPIRSAGQAGRHTNQHVVSRTSSHQIDRTARKRLERIAVSFLSSPFLSSASQLFLLIHIVHSLLFSYLRLFSHVAT